MGTKDAGARDTLYVEALAAPNTITTIPAKTLRAFADHGELHGVVAADGGDAEEVLKRFADAAVDVDAIATHLQRQGAEEFVKSWHSLLARIAEKRPALGRP
jgi:transaldolase